MSIYGVPNTRIPQPATQPGVRDGARGPVQQPGARGVQPSAPRPLPAPASPASVAVGQQSVPVEPPPGTDPALWSVLSGDERAFFAKAGAMGPLTYGRVLQEMRTAQLPASRGGRLDVKI